MDNYISIKLKGNNVPEWAKNGTWVHINEHGEQWVAKIVEDKLMITGSDIGWKEIRLSAEQLTMEKSRLQTPDHFLYEVNIKETAATANDSIGINEISKTIDILSINHPLIQVVLNEGERHWILSVICAAIPHL
jgi:hypothetical protein